VYLVTLCGHDHAALSRAGIDHTGTSLHLTEVDSSYDDELIQSKKDTLA